MSLLGALVAQAVGRSVACDRHNSRRAAIYADRLMSDVNTERQIAFIFLRFDT
jgi:hypothetical protein